MITIVIISYQITKSHVIIELITLVDNKHPMANPFFSGRIPQSLYDRVEQYINESGKSKTELLINALSNYLDFPVEIKPTNNSNDELWIFVKELQERIEKLEEGSIDKNVITDDNKDITKINVTPEQLSLLKNESIKPNTKLLTTKEFIELPDIRKLDTQKIKIKLNNARQQQKLPIKIENYSIEDGGKDPNSPRNILWKVTTDNF